MLYISGPLSVLDPLRSSGESVSELSEVCEMRPGLVENISCQTEWTSDDDEWEAIHEMSKCEDYNFVK